MTFVDNGNGTATLSGTPAAGTAGTYPLTITASNGVGSPANQSFTLTVNPAAAGPVNVTTSLYNNQRISVNASESILTPANVNSTSFGKLFSQSVDGQIYAQPLYVANLTIGGAAHNVVYVATEQTVSMPSTRTPILERTRSHCGKQASSPMA